MGSTTTTSAYQYLLHIILLGLLYFVVARLGLSLSVVGENVTLIWPPTGLALAAFLLYGGRLWPGVLLGSFAANILTDISMAAALGIAGGNTMEGLVGYWLLRRSGFSTALDSVRDVFSLIVLGAMVSTVVSATVGVSVLVLDGVITMHYAASTWLTWWMGDALGDLVFAPLFLVWLTHTKYGRDTSRILEALLLLLVLLSTSYLVFGEILMSQHGSYPIAFMPFPALIWAAWRFGQRGATAATLIITGVALWHIVHRSGLMAFENSIESMVMLWLYANALSATGLVVAAAISQRRKAESDLLLAASVFRNTSEAVLITDANRHIVSVNQAFTELTGYTQLEVQGQYPAIFNAGQHDQGFYEQMWATVDTQGVWQGEVWDRDRSGEVFACWLTVNVIRDESGKVSNYISIASDITEKKHSEAHIRHLAQHDVLTGLPNRTLLQDRLEQALTLSARHTDMAAILFIDLDRFKVINDTLGHDCGDILLGILAERLRECVRQEDTVGRQGGDEFLIVLSEITQPQDAALVAQKILSVVAKPFRVRDYELHVTPSIGISIYPEDGRDATTLLKNADTAMYQAKQTGGTYRFYAAEMNASAFERLSVENNLRHALDKNEFVLYYQPLVELSSGTIIGMEALIRWQHPTMGLVMPDVFIPIAEETGLIIPIGEWVMREACKQCVAWHALVGPEFKMAINISARQFWQGNLVETLEGIMREVGVDSSHLELELTESMLMRHTDETVALLNRLRGLGLRLSIDDFGTGYSSLSYLKRFPIHKLKIDRSFTLDLATDPDDAAIINAIIALARSLNMTVIAEGIESVEQQDYLVSQQCDEGQGYYFGEPMPAANCDNLLRIGRLPVGS